MEVKLRALRGPLEGKDLLLKEGSKIGRVRGDLVLNDQKVSSLHAVVVVLKSGRLGLRDNGSKNGIRIGGKKVSEFAFEKGLKFEIGLSLFEVVSDSVSVKNEAGTSTLRAEPDDAGPPSTDVVSPQAPVPGSPERSEAKRWNDYLAEAASQAASQATDGNAAPKPFTPPIQLTFIGGIQAETQWILGYGPRRAGAVSIDLPIFEPKAPAQCFELIPGDSGAVFSTEHPGKVKINGQALPRRVLESGDIISVGDSRIEVEWHE